MSISENKTKRTTKATKAAHRPRKSKAEAGSTPATAPQDGDANTTMSVQLRQKYDKIYEILSSSKASEMDAQYAVGQEVKAVKEGENSTYGSGAVATLAKSLHIEVTKLYDCSKVAECWPPEEFQNFQAPQEGDKINGVGLTWSHLVTVASVKKKKDRQRYLDDTLANGWTVRDLKKAIGEAKAKAAEKANTDPVSLQHLKQFVAASSLKKVPSWEEIMVDSHDDLRGQLATPESLDLLRQAEEAQQNIKTRAEQNIDALSQTIGMILDELKVKTATHESVEPQPDPENHDLPSNDEEPHSGENVDTDAGDEDGEAAEAEDPDEDIQIEDPEVVEEAA